MLLEPLPSQQMRTLNLVELEELVVPIHLSHLHSVVPAFSVAVEAELEDLTARLQRTSLEELEALQTLMSQAEVALSELTERRRQLEQTVLMGIQLWVELAAVEAERLSQLLLPVELEVTEVEVVEVVEAVESA